MPYRFLEDAFTADIGFVACGASLAECFSAAAEATLAVMLENAAELRAQSVRRIHVEAAAPDLALLNFLEELVYHKDAEQLLLRPVGLGVTQRGQRWVVDAELAGEVIDRARHHLAADVKAITLHRLAVRRVPEGWEATVVVDI